MMTAEQFERQKNYCVIMIIAKRWLKDGIITQKDLNRIHRHFVLKYRPVIELF